MLDGYGRSIDYVRLSITDKCQLRCSYCIPDDSLDEELKEAVLSFEDMLEIIKVLVELGVKKVKITGGEPLLYPGILDLIRDIKSIDQIEQVTLTTNGVSLARMVDDLVKAGIDGINISLDTLDKLKYKLITKRDGLDTVLIGLKKAVDLGINVKVNCVLISELNKDEIVEIAKLAQNDCIQIRFIEYMPMLSDVGYTRVPLSWVKEQLSIHFGELVTVNKKLGNGPASYYKIDGFVGHVGFISAVSNHFCKTCNRLRVTSDGFLKTCLYYHSDVNLKEVVDDKDALRRKVIEAVNDKPKTHQFNYDKLFAGKERRNMARIGG